MKHHQKPLYPTVKELLADRKIELPFQTTLDIQMEVRKGLCELYGRRTSYKRFSVVSMLNNILEFEKATVIETRASLCCI